MNETHDGSQKSPDRPAPFPSDAVLPAIPSEQLLRGNKEVLINHQGNVYRLRCTKNGKLILHK